MPQICLFAHDAAPTPPMRQCQPLQVRNVVAVDEGEVWCKFLAGGGCGVGGLHFAAGAGDAPQVAAQLAQHGGFVSLAHIADHYGHLAAHAAQALDALAHGVDPVGGVLVAAVFSAPPFQNGAGLRGAVRSRAWPWAAQ